MGKRLSDTVSCFGGVHAAVVSALRPMSWGVIVAAGLAAGCKSDFNHQLLERELRMQEDQIYTLQDELQDKCSRLDRMVAENVSLKKQLGIADGGGPTVPSGPASRFQPTPASPPSGPAGIAPPVLVPPTVDDVPPPAATLPPPAADGPRFGPPGDEPPAFRGEAAAPVTPLSHEESLAAEAQVTHLVLNRDRTQCFDGDGDGVSDGLAIVFEPRDADERLVNAAGDVSVAVYEPTSAGAGNPSGEGTCVARWEIPAAQAADQFRRTSRARGVHLVQRWPGPPPASEHVRVFVRMVTFEGKAVEADGTVPVASDPRHDQ